MANVRFLPNVIKYDRYQPEFYEDTKTYITKRTSNKKVSKGVNFYNENKSLIKFWTTIVVYKGDKEITREIGLNKKEEIYKLIKKGI